MRLNFRGSPQAVLGAAGGARSLDVDVVGPEPALAFLALDQRVGKVLHMARGVPDPGMHQDRGVQANDVVVHLGHFLPPHTLNIFFEFDAQRTVVPGPGLAAVDFTGLENEASSLAQRHQFFKGDFRFLLVFLFRHVVLSPAIGIGRARPGTWPVAVLRASASPAWGRGDPR